MKFYDISRDIMTTQPYGSDPEPRVTALCSIENGDMYNMTEFTMCSHQATHIDAPLHFDDDGSDIAGLRLAPFYGKCTVVSIDGILTGEDMEELSTYVKEQVEGILFSHLKKQVSRFSAAQAEKRERYRDFAF